MDNQNQASGPPAGEATLADGPRSLPAAHSRRRRSHRRRSRPYRTGSDVRSHHRDRNRGAGPVVYTVVLPRALTILLGLAALTVTAAGIAAAAWLIGPVFLALVVVIMVSPVQERLRRLGWPAWVTVLVLLAGVYGLVLLLSGTVVASLARLGTVLTGYAAEANALLASALTRLAQFGVGPEQLRAVLSSLDVNRLVPLVTGLLLGLGGLAANLVFLLSLLLFLIIESSGAGARLAVLSADRAPVAAALGRFARGTRRFIGVTTVIGLVTGVVDAVFLWLVGVPLAVLWGVLVFLTNYIPYVGFWIGLAPPAILALLAGGWPLLLVVLGVFLVVNFVLTSLVQPYYVGDAVDLSVTVVLVSLVFWAWLMGPVGAAGGAAHAVRQVPAGRRRPQRPLGVRLPRFRSSGPPHP